ncbi:MAG: threonine/serine exporter family protein [Eubacteriales bacterium]|nr:threonine/serine exporter family protein [Eubacteriales bacterium]
MALNIELVVLSFLASLGFAIVFQMRKEDLVWAGIGGLVTRIAYIILMAFIPYRIVYAALAAGAADIFAEIMAHKKHTPATYYLYPAIIPLIPGDLLYYTMGGIILNDREMAMNYGQDCLLALVGICVGFVCCSTVFILLRRFRFFAASGN